MIYGITFTEDDAKEWVRTCAVDHSATVDDVLGHYSIEEIYVQMAYEKARPILLSLVTYTFGELPMQPETDEPASTEATTAETAAETTAAQE